MQLTTVNEMIGLQTLLAVVISASLLTTAQTRLVSKHSEEEYDDVDGPEDDDYVEEGTVAVLCAPDTYYDLKQDDCTPCSSCPINNIIVRPCHRFQDTMCAPFYKLNEFWKSKSPPDISSQNLSSAKSKDNSKDSNNHHGKQRIFSSDSSSSEWKSLSLILFVVIALLFSCLVSSVVVFCYLKRRTYNTTKEIVCEYGPAPDSPVDV